jgi:hypothetical protein
MPAPIFLEIIFRPGMDPFDRQWFEEQLEESFAEEGLGQVLGGGTALDGSSSDIALEINQRERGLAVVLALLRREQAPRDTRIVEQGAEDVTHAVYDSQHPYVEPARPEVVQDGGKREPRPLDLPQLGDTFLVPLGGDVYGACRVIRIRNGEYATLVAGTDWFGAAPPALSEALLHSLLVHTCLGAIGPSCTYWLVGKPPAEFRYLGVIEPSATEQKIDIGDYTEHWSFVANGLRLQWDWLRKQPK